MCYRFTLTVWGLSMRMLAIIFAAFAAIVCASGEALAGKRVALVIGNAAYRNVAPLTNPANDAAAIAEMFRQAKFDVVALHGDLGNIGMRRALRDFSDQARGADIAVVYFAGHGMEVDGINYLIPVDATIERDTDTYDEAIALDRILQAVEPARQLRLVILDACRDNPFVKKMRRLLAARSLGRGLAGIEPSLPNTLVAYAAKGGSTAADGNGRNSPFAGALLKHLTTPGLGVRRALGFVRDDVLAMTDNRQEPFVYGSLGGDEVPLVPVATADAASNMRGDYELAAKVGTREAWESFIKAYPSGFYADLARAQRAKLIASGAEPAATSSDRKGGEGAAGAAKAAEPAKASDAGSAPPQTMAALPQPAEATPKVSGAGDAELARLLQAELNRVGCGSGETDGVWGTASQRALAQFNRHAGTRFDAARVSPEALAAVRGKSGRVCPQSCGRGARLVDGKCVAANCRRGYQRDDDGLCRPAARATREDREPRQRQPVARRAPSSGGAQVICDDHGCRPVSRGCRASAASGPYQSQICE